MEVSGVLARHAATLAVVGPEYANAQSAGYLSPNRGSPDKGATTDDGVKEGASVSTARCLVLVRGCRAVEVRKGVTAASVPTSPIVPFALNLATNPSPTPPLSTTTDRFHHSPYPR